MIVDTNTLKGAALDWAVAEAEGLNAIYPDGIDYSYQPSEDGEHSSQIVIRERILVEPVYSHPEKREFGEYWRASMRPDWDRAFTYSKSYHEAAMRCYVRHKLGATVDIPDALIKDAGKTAKP